MSGSFIERNKAWILPLLGVMAVGVIYMNVKMLGPKPTPPPEPAAAGPAPGPAASAAPAPVAPPPSAPAAPTPGSELWADLRALETPAPALNAKEALLAKAAETLKGEDLAGPGGATGPGRTGPSLEEAPRPKAATSGPAPVFGPVPEVDFLIRSAQGASAWREGAGIREGQELAPGWRVRRITQGMVEVEGPGGRVRKWTNPLRAQTSPSPTPSSIPPREVP
jgi:pyruvate/2-oxoglutarate dehydrogenase complex dihydrolipoamide acyltransferase (E2) component